MQDSTTGRFGKIKFAIGAEVKSYEGVISEERGIYILIETCGREHRIPKFRAVVSFLPKIQK